jgi:PIN domain nuclease of toxin-antitoxin system
LTLLLDTQVLLWWLAGGERLSKKSRDAISLAEAVFVSAASAWEIGIKVGIGKLGFRGDLERQVAINNFLGLPVTLAHAAAAGKLPRLHDDPFDRMLVAQAGLESLTLLTSDKQLAAYDVKVMLA